MSSLKLNSRPSFKRSHSDLSRSTTPVPPEADIDELRVELPPFLSQDHNDLVLKFAIIQETDRRRIESYCRQADQDPDLDHPWALHITREASLRNRYSDVQPWAKSRVRLKVRDGESDYINASPISLARSDGQYDLRYIAAQGPKINSVDHFWQMIWHECSQTAVIVMLTQLSEGSREKCSQYFPAEGELNHSQPKPKPSLSRSNSRAGTPPTGALSSPGRSHKPSPTRPSMLPRLSTPDPSTATQPSLALTLTTPDGEPVAANLTLIDTHFDEDSQATVRKLSLTCREEARIVYHLLFSGWPDFGVPNGANRSAMLALVRLSNEKNDVGGPRIVHCSAGVGRTGTFIALEHLLGELDSGAWDVWDEAKEREYLETHSYQGHENHVQKYDDETLTWPDPIFDAVSRLREQRANMVQSQPQFLFIYEIMAEEWLKRRKAILDDKIRSAEPNPKVLRLGIGGLKKIFHLARSPGKHKAKNHVAVTDADSKVGNEVTTGSGGNGTYN